MIFQDTYKLQAWEYQVECLIAYKNALIQHMSGKVRELNWGNFAVCQHLKYVDLYSEPSDYQGIKIIR